MKFYLNSAQSWGPYDDLKRNKLMQKYVREIEKETGVEATFEKDIAFEGNCVIDISSMKTLVQITKAVGNGLVIEQIYRKDDKYPTICIYDDFIEEREHLR